MRATFDTLDYTKGAEAIGIKREHAEYQARAMAKMINDTLVTKNDLHLVETSLKNDVSLVKSELIKQISNLEMRMIKWMIGVAIGQSALILTVIGLWKK
jgi:hypothetical protein